jgi:hypothetical protein
MVFNLDLAVGWLSAQNSLAVALAGSQRRSVMGGGLTPAETLLGSALAALSLDYGPLATQGEGVLLKQGSAAFALAVAVGSAGSTNGLASSPTDPGITLFTQAW